MRVEIKGNILGPIYEIDGLNDVFITHHYRHVKDDGVAIPTAHNAQVEVALGAVHVWMSPQEADGFGKRLQALSGATTRHPDRLDQAAFVMGDRLTPFAVPEMAARAHAALREVIEYLKDQRS